MRIIRKTLKAKEPLDPELKSLAQHALHDDQQIKDFVNMTTWAYPKSDMEHFIQLLNRFDDILSAITTVYNLKEHVQKEPFTEQEKSLLLGVLKFTKLLFDNCKNAHLYDSYEHLRSLLNTTDIDVLEATMKALLKPIRMNYGSNRQTSPKDYVKLARGGGSIGCGSPVNLFDRLQQADTFDITTAPSAAKIQLTFFRTSTDEQGMKTIDCTVNQQQQRLSDRELFWKLVNEYSVPEEYHYELLVKVRIANNIQSKSVCRQLLVIRLIAIVIMVYAVPETLTQNRLFAYEPHLVQQLAQLLTYDEKDSLIDVQTYALYALEATTRHKTKMTEVLSALNVSANHGILLHILRRLIYSDSVYTNDFYIAFFTLLTSFLNSPAGETMLMTAGLTSTLVETLVQANENPTVNGMALIHILELLNKILMRVEAAYSSFFNSNGIHVIANTIKVFVDSWLERETENIDQFRKVKYEYAQVIKRNLSFLVDLMDPSYTTSTTDGLRNLMEATSIPQSIIKICRNQFRYGPAVLSEAMNLTTIFIHSEPTSLSALQQELKLPQALLNALNEYYKHRETLEEGRPLYTPELLESAVCSFGALCLNEAGLTMLTEFDTLSHFFQLLSAPLFVKHYIHGLPQEIATKIGLMMDELIRHHPKLTEQVHQLIEDGLLKQVIAVGTDEKEEVYPSRPEDHSDKLVLHSVAMKKGQPRCLVLGYIEITAKFLAGFLKFAANLEDLVGLGKMLLQYYELPTLPYDFEITTAFDSLSLVFKMLASLNPVQIAGLIAQKIYDSSRFLLEDFVKPRSRIYDIIMAIDHDDVALEAGNKLFRKCGILFGYTGLLSSVFASSLPSSKHATELIDWCLKKVFPSFNKSDTTAENRKSLMEVLGEIQQTMIWQNILLRNAAPKAWYNSTLEDGDDENKLREPRLVNTRRFKLLIAEIPPAIMPMFQKLPVPVQRLSYSPKSEQSDKANKQALQVALSMASYFKSCLQYLDGLEELDCRHDFYASILSMISMLLPSSTIGDGTLDTPLAIALQLEGVLHIMLHSMLPQLWKQAELLVDKEGADLQQVDKVNTCFELLLATVSHLGLTEDIATSRQYKKLLTLENGKYKELEPGKWVIAVKLEVCSGLLPYLSSPHFSKLPKRILESHLRCLMMFFKDDESRWFPSMKRNKDSEDLHIEDELRNDFDAISSMGFDRNTTVKALRRFKYGLCALDYLLSRRLVEHPVSAGRPTFTYDPAFRINFSKPLTVAERNAVRRIFVNLWYEQEAVEKVLTEVEGHLESTDREEYNLIHQMVTLLNNMDPAPVRSAAELQCNNSSSEAVRQQAEEVEEVVEDDGDENFEDIDSMEEDEEDEASVTIEEKEDTVGEQEKHQIMEKLRIVRQQISATVPKVLASLVEVRTDVDLVIRDFMLTLLDGIDDQAFTDAKAVIEIFSQNLGLKNDPNPVTAVEDKRALFEASINRIRIFALMLHDPEDRNIPAMLPLLISTLSDFIDWFDFLDIIVSYPEFANPNWLTILFSVLEVKLAYSDAPTVDSNGNKQGNEDVKKDASIDTAENRAKLLTYCISLLKIDNLTQDNLIATIRIIVRLTKHYAAAELFIDQDGLELLFQRLTKNDVKLLKAVHVYILIILRHLVESKEVISERIQEWLPHWLSISGMHTVDSFVRSNGFLALRDPDEFLKVSTDVARMEFFANGNDHYISLRSDYERKDRIITTNRCSTIVMNFLLQQLDLSVNTYGENTMSSAYTAFLLQAVFELLSSYPHCKYDILAFSESAHIHDSVLYKLVTRILPAAELITPSSNDSEKSLKQHLSKWVHSIIINLCYDTTRLPIADNDDKTMPPNERQAIIPVRKHVLDIILRALNDALLEDNNMIKKFRHYTALAELCTRTLSIAGSPKSPGAKISHESISEVCQLMIEKNFVPLFVTLIEDVDENYPHAKLVYTAILSFLEHLAKLASRLDPATVNIGGNKEQLNNNKEEEEEEDEVFIPMDTDDDYTMDEEVTDIYRNSSLAMMDGTVMEEEEQEEEESTSGSDVEMASSGEEVIDDSSTSCESESESELEEDEEMEDLMRSHRYHQSDTEDDEMSETSDDDDGDSVTDSESGTSYTSESHYDSSDNSSEASTDRELDEMASAFGGRVIRDEENGHRTDRFRRERTLGTDNDVFSTASEDSESDNVAEIFSGTLNNLQESNIDLGNGGSYLGNITNVSVVRNNLRRTENDLYMLLHPLVRNAMAVDEAQRSSAPGPSGENNSSSIVLQAFEDIIGFSALRLSEELIRQLGQPGRSINPQRQTTNMINASTDEELTEALNVIQHFKPVQTVDRWSQEYMMVFIIPVATEKASILTPILTERLQGTMSKASPSKETSGENNKTINLSETELYLPVELNDSTEDVAGEMDAQEEDEDEDDMTMEEESSEEGEEPVTIMIDGEEVDISGTGIDIEFLRAIPEHLRAEVLNQSAMEYQTSTERIEDEFSPEFLNALPQELRTEISQQLSSQQTSGTGVETPSTAATSEEETDPEQSDLSDNDDEQDSKDKNNSRTAILHRDAIHLVEYSGLMALVELLFVPHSISRTSLNKLLLSLCENRKTRNELLSILLYHLQEACKLSTTTNAVPVDEREAKLGIKNTMVIQRCLETLYYVITWNDRSLGFFLVNKEIWARQRQRIINGRGWESKPPEQTPLLFLLDLLDSKAFVNNTMLMEQLTNFLMTVCRSYTKLVYANAKAAFNDQKQAQHQAPDIPSEYHQKVVNVLCIGECPQHTFRHTVQILNSLMYNNSGTITIEALVSAANTCGSQVENDLNQLSTVLEHSKEGANIEDSSLLQFSAANSPQTRLLRIIKTLDYLHTQKSNLTASKLKQNQKALVAIYSKLNLSAVWRLLSNCLGTIQRNDLLNVASVLLPLVESFMTVSKYSIGNLSNRKIASVEQFFVTFTEEHKKLLNIMVRNNPSLMSGVFSILVKNPKILEFDNKRNYFNQQLDKRAEESNVHNSIRLHVHRDHVFEDTYRQLQGYTGEEIRYGQLSVQFENEDGADAGGLSREWFQILARQMFDPNYALFITSAADKLTYQPNRASGINPEHLNYFKFVGRIIGKAIHDGRLLDAYFTRSFYKLILGRSVDYRDLETVDLAYYKSLVWMLDNDITDIIDLTFSIEMDDFGTTKTIDLKPNGRNIPVTEANKSEYVALVTEHKLVLVIRNQVNAFLEGLHDIIPKDLIQIFNEQELELLISGLPDIDIDDWKANTVYEGYSLSSPQIQWFWRAVRSFDQEERAKLLQFSTGTSKVPLEGFAKLQGSNGIQKFNIHKDFGSVNRLPSAHTCFNQIDLPQYESYDILRSQLFKAISECSTGFGFE